LPAAILCQRAVNLKLPISNCRPLGRAVSPLAAARSPVNDGAHGVTRPTGSIVNSDKSRARDGSRCRQSSIVNAFTLVEILVVVVLLSFIILALMTVFNATQTAFRASITQTDVMEGGRSAMGLIKSDLESMTPSFGVSNGTVNFCAVTNYYQYQSGPGPLVQTLTGVSNPNTQRTNVL